MSKEVRYLGENLEYEIVDGGSRKRLENTITDVEYDSTTSRFIFTRTRNDGSAGRQTVINVAKNILVKSGKYNSSTKQFELLLTNGNYLYIPASDLIDSINEYQADEVTLTVKNNLFSLTSDYKNKINLAYTLYKNRNELITRTMYANNYDTGIVKIGSTLKVNDYGKVDLPDGAIISATPIAIDNALSTELGSKFKDASGVIHNHTTKYSKDSFKYTNGSLTLSDKVIDLIDSKVNSSDVLLLSGGTLVGDLNLNGNTLKNIKIQNSDNILMFNDAKLTLPKNSSVIATVDQLNDYISKNDSNTSKITIGTAGLLQDNDGILELKTNSDSLSIETTLGSFNMLGRDGSTYNLDNLLLDPITRVDWTNNDYKGTLTFYTSTGKVANTINIALESIFTGTSIVDGNIQIHMTNGDYISIPVADLLHDTDNETIIVNTDGNIALNSKYSTAINTSISSIKLNNLGSLVATDNSGKEVSCITFDTDSFIIQNKILKLNPDYVKNSALNDYLKVTDAMALYQPIGSYVSAQTVSDMIKTAEVKYVNVDGDTMTGNLEFTGSDNHITVPLINSNTIKANTLTSNTSNTLASIDINPDNQELAFNKANGSFKFNLSGYNNTLARILEVNKTGLFLDIDTNNISSTSSYTNADYSSDLHKNILSITQEKFIYSADNSLEIANNKIKFNNKKILTEDDIIQYEVPLATEDSIGGIRIADDPVLKYNSETGVFSTDMSNYMDSEAITNTFQLKGDYALKSDIAGVYHFEGSVDSYLDLPTENLAHGVMYDVKEAFILLDTTNNIPAGNYPAGTNFAWNSNTNTWDSLGGIFDTSNLVTKQEFITGLDTYISDNKIISQDEIDANYVRLSVANDTYVKLNDYIKYEDATSSKKGVISIDKAGYMNSSPTISYSDGNIYITSDNIKNALGYIPARQTAFGNATYSTAGTVVIDKFNTDKTISVNEDNGNIYLTKANLDNAAGFTILSKDDTDGLYVSSTKDQNITGTKTYLDGVNLYYDGAVNIKRSLNSNVTWSRDLYSENIILPQISNTTLPASKDLKFRRVVDIVDGNAYFDTLMTLKADGTLVKNITAGEDPYITDSSLTTVIKSIQDQIDAINTRITDMHYTRMVINTFSLETRLFEIGSIVRLVKFNHTFNTNPVSYTIAMQDPDTEELTELKSVICVDGTIYDTTSINDIEIDSDTTFKITAVGNGSDNINTAMTTAKFVNRIYYGVSDEPVLDLTNPEARSCLTGELSDNKKKTIELECSDNCFVYYACPTRLGIPTFKIGSFEGGLELVNTIDITNNSNYTESYYVYRSEYDSLGEITLKVK